MPLPDPLTAAKQRAASWDVYTGEHIFVHYTKDDGVWVIYWCPGPSDSQMLII
jgi:hypothetical protein